MVPERILPPALEEGDHVAVIATSNNVEAFPHVLDAGLNQLRDRFGLEPVVYPTAKKDTAYLNANPADIATDLMNAFEDPTISGVIAVTGGDEQIRMLKHLSPDRLRQHPTRFFGISDNTHFHLYLWNLGIISFYGGQILDDLLANGNIGQYTYRHLDAAFFADQFGDLEPADEYTDAYFDLRDTDIPDSRTRFDAPDWEFWNASTDVCRGRLWGGCLSILDQQLAAGTYLPPKEALEGAILALETSEVCPEPQFIRKLLFCMGERGILELFNAVLVGRPMRAPLANPDRPMDEKIGYHATQKSIIKEELGRYCPETPAVFDVDFGHTHPKIPLPIGGTITIDPVTEQIRIDDLSETS